MGDNLVELKKQWFYEHEQICALQSLINRFVQDIEIDPKVDKSHWSTLIAQKQAELFDLRDRYEELKKESDLFHRTYDALLTQVEKMLEENKRLQVIEKEYEELKNKHYKSETLEWPYF